MTIFVLFQEMIKLSFFYHFVLQIKDLNLFKNLLYEKNCWNYSYT